MAVDGYGVRQVASSISVAVVAILLGVPLWWRTTEVYRASLPYSSIANLSTLMTPLIFTVNLSVQGPVNEETEKMADFLQKQLNAQPPSSKIAVQYKLGNTGFTVTLDPAVQLSTIEVHSSPSMSVPVTKDHQKTALQVKSVLDNIVIVPKELLTCSKDGVVETSKDQMRVLKSARGYHISFTLLVPDPHFYMAGWNIEEAVEGVLRPFIQQLEAVRFASFSVESQVQFYTDLGFRIKKRKGNTFVSVGDLSEALSHAEAKLASHISQLPDVNFLVYIPRREEYPLYIAAGKDSWSASNAFLSPQWGGMVIFNPPKVNSTTESSERAQAGLDMNKLMPVFVAQLRELLGVPQVMQQSGVAIEDLPVNKLHDWQLDRLLRCKLAENLQTTSSTLTSLVSLLDQVKNMVISDEIQHLVEVSVAAVQESTALLQDGRLHEAYTQSVQAMSNAETAFFDQSILELLYFPDDQKYGVYVPLFVPLSVPILMSLVRAFKWIRSGSSRDSSTDHESPQD